MLPRLSRVQKSRYAPKEDEGYIWTWTGGEGLSCCKWLMVYQSICRKIGDFHKIFCLPSGRDDVYLKTFTALGFTNLTWSRSWTTAPHSGQLKCLYLQRAWAIIFLILGWITYDMNVKNDFVQNIIAIYPHSLSSEYWVAVQEIIHEYHSNQCPWYIRMSMSEA
jgi:hypothetical protein